MCNKSKDCYEDTEISNEKIKMFDIYSNIALSESDICNNNVSDAKDSLKKLRKKFNL